MLDNAASRTRACVLLPLLLLAAGARAQAFNRTSPAGANLAPLTYYTSEWVFTDVFRQAAPWWSQEVNGWTWSTTVPLAVDANGWVTSLQPNQAAGTLLFRDVQGRYPGGRYVLTYDGDGDLQVGFDGKIVSQTTGRIYIAV